MTKNIKISPSRVCAYKVLSEVLINGAYSNVALNRHLLPLKDEKDRRLCTNIVYGTIKKINRLDDILSSFSRIALEDIDERVRISLVMGIYQIVYLDRIPEYALVNDSVNIVKMFVSKKAVGFANGVLRNVLRKKNELKNHTYSDFSDRLYFEYGFDRNLQKDLLNQWTKEELLDYAEYSEKAPEMTIRVNTLKTTPEKLMDSLSSSGIECERTVIDECIRILSHVNITLLEQYREGLFSVQDMASMTVARSLDAGRGMKILDMCAAPGGKSMHLAELTGDGCDITSSDIYEKKLQIMRMRASQLGISSIRTVKMDSAVFRPEFKDKFDRIICDVPCSGLGVIRRKPEILYSYSYEKVKELTSIQEKILENALRYLKPGGLMTYSTCTVNRRENEDVLFKVLERNEGYYLSAIDPGFEIKGADPESGIISIRGEKNMMDSFFIAGIRRDS